MPIKSQNDDLAQEIDWRIRGRAEIAHASTSYLKNDKNQFCPSNFLWQNAHATTGAFS